MQILQGFDHNLEHVRDGVAVTGQLEFVEVLTGEAPAFSVIWLHGLGADGHDFEPIVPALTLPVPMRFIFPHAPERAVTINQGMTMRAWYDILSLDRFSVEDDRWGSRRLFSFSSARRSSPAADRLNASSSNWLNSWIRRASSPAVRARP